MESDGSTVQISQAIYPGAEGRYEDWVYLKMLEREWLRPLTDADRFLSISEPSRPAARAIIVIVFWSYFETRVERLLRHGMGHLPHGVVEDLLRRYSSVGSRLDRLYKIVYSTTYHADLTALGYSEVSRLLDRVQLHRNEFTHGHPEAIDDALIESLVGGLKDEHESWIAVFNKRVSEARPQTP